MVFFNLPACILLALEDGFCSIYIPMLVITGGEVVFFISQVICVKNIHVPKTYCFTLGSCFCFVNQFIFSKDVCL